MSLLDNREPPYAADLRALSAHAPLLREHDGIIVARDDLFPGGTKARFLWRLFDTMTEGLLDAGPVNELVYASPPEGGAQTALAYCGRALGKRVTIFTAARAKPHPRSLMAAHLGARVEYIRPGYLNVVQRRAADYCRETGARLVPFGADVTCASDAIARAARATGLQPDEVWCAAGSGVLARALAVAFPLARRQVVQVGRTLSERDVAGARIHVHPLPFATARVGATPFPSDPHYDAKAWEVCLCSRGPGTVLFWNVTGPANPGGCV